MPSCCDVCGRHPGERDPVLPSWNDGAARTAILAFVDA